MKHYKAGCLCWFLSGEEENAMLVALKLYRDVNVREEVEDIKETRETVIRLIEEREKMLEIRYNMGKDPHTRESEKKMKKLIKQKKYLAAWLFSELNRVQNLLKQWEGTDTKKKEVKDVGDFKKNF